MMHPSIEYSVVIPARDAQDYVEEAVASALAQSIPPREVIVVDDHSLDATAKVARAAGALVVANPRRPGASAARNVGIAQAKAKVVAFLDADDRWTSVHAATCLVAFGNDASVVSFSRTTTFGTNAGTVWPKIAAGTISDALSALLEDNVVPQSAAFVSRRALVEVGGYDESIVMSEDYDLWCRLAPKCTFVHASDITVERRCHDRQTTHGRSAVMRRSAWEVRKRMFSSIAAADMARYRGPLCRALEQELETALREEGLSGVSSVCAIARALDSEAHASAVFDGAVLRALPAELARHLARSLVGAFRLGPSTRGQSLGGRTRRAA